MTVEAAARAIQRVVEIRSGTGLALSVTEMMEMWFPRQTLAFTEAEVREALTNLLYSGTIAMDKERYLVPMSESGWCLSENGWCPHGRRLATCDTCDRGSMMEPIPMRLPCPSCGALHIDRGEFATKPHHTHACQECGMVWRPAIVPTVGVDFLPGFKDEV